MCVTMNTLVASIVVRVGDRHAEHSRCTCSLPFLSWWMYVITPASNFLAVTFFAYDLLVG